MTASKQPPRGPYDGPVGVRRVGDEFIITAAQCDVETTCRASEYNAWRIFGALAAMLGVTLPKKVASSIQLGVSIATMGVDLPPDASIGQHVGAAMAAKKTAERMRRAGVDVNAARGRKP